jgi:hypothetical protein
MSGLLDGVERELRPSTPIKTKAALRTFRSRLGQRRVMQSRKPFERELEVFLQSSSILRAASRRHIRKKAPPIIFAVVATLKKARLFLASHAPNTY